MKNVQQIYALGLKETRVTFAKDAEYCFRKDRPYHIIQKVCIAILRRLRCHALGENITYNRIVIEGNEFVDKLFKQVENLGWVFGLKPAEILIGEEDFYEIMGASGKPNGGMFQFQQEYHISRSIYGLRVKVIPWMRGVLVMPRG